ncbi:hypothetical protein CV102_25690 [Natronococcus pandeyae]|uniref:Uncharacterized protein n=1 Tax=Natronococcus pandeyae TaxID=2055836 RepID=A0A8J8Q148_9EURY|nr:hypothetical protein CV102_25690 [Natronococcus pandeyae]
MDKRDTLQSPADSPNRDQSIHCTACESSLQSPGRESISFLLLDQFTIPLVGCDNHLEEFCSICGLATEGSAELLNHRPAGGVHCPSCRHAPHRPHQSIIPVGGGGLAILACSTHQSDILDRFRTGLQIRHHLNSSLDAFSTNP